MSTERRIAIISIFSLCLALLSSFFVVSASAYDVPSTPKTEKCAAACLYDKTHGRILYIENGDKILNTSTSAKVMMGLLACEMLGDRLDETVTLTDAMLRDSSGYSMGLKSGEQIGIRDLLYGAICGSYNDAAYALASICAGSSAEFTALMNQRAAALGASATSYTNPLGYPDSDSMVTTVSDTLKIAIEASENELYMKLCSTKSHTVSATNLNSAKTVFNRNRLVYTPPNTSSLYFNPACLGMNAGSSGERGGWSVMTVAQDDGAELICIVLGGEESEDGEIFAYKTANMLIDHACNTYDTVSFFEKGEVLGKAKVTMTAFGSDEVDFKAAAPLDTYIPTSRAGDVELKVEYASSELRAPIKAGERIGAVSAYLDGELVGSCDILLAKNCDANAVMKVISAIGEYTGSRAFISSVVFFVIALPVALIVSKRRNGVHRVSKRRY